MSLTCRLWKVLLIGRLWWSDNRVKRYRSGEASTSVPWQVMKTIIQSQFAYSLVVVLNVAAYAVRSNLAVLTTAILPSLLVRPIRDRSLRRLVLVLRVTLGREYPSR